MASLQIHASTISAIAEHVVEARRLYGPDSSYVLGIFQGFELLLDNTGGTDTQKAIQNEVIRLEASMPVGASSPQTSTQTQTAGRSAAPVEGAPAAEAEALEENSWIKGAVKWFNNDKGYGFISTAADADVFVHWRDISSWDRSLAQGDEVEFMVTKTAKGYQAINVMKPGTGDDSQVAAAGANASEPAAGDGPEAAVAPAPPSDVSSPQVSSSQVSSGPVSSGQAPSSQAPSSQAPSSQAASTEPATDPPRSTDA